MGKIEFTYYLEEKRYNECQNFKIKFLNSHSKICYIFCSSNGIYTGINETNYQEYIRKDYYEWENVSKNKMISKNAGMYIFVRDVFQKCYVNGINCDTNSVDKLIQFLKEKTLGYELIVVGNSGGGYLAILLGTQLENVKRVYSFGGLFSLYSWTGSNNNVSFERTYKKWIGDLEREKWFSLYKLVQNYPVPLLHFCGIKHVGDAEQIRPLTIACPANIHIFKMNNNAHSGHIPGYNYPKLLTADRKHLSKLYKLSNKSSISCRTLSIKNIGILKYGFYIIKSMLKALKINKVF